MFLLIAPSMAAERVFFGIISPSITGKKGMFVDAKIASFTSNSYRISFFAKREPISFHHSSLKDINLTNQIFEATYVQDLFPILEQNEIFYFYINKKMKQKLLKDQGFLFLLQNERFKFMHSHGEHEVWMFNKGD